ncbi:MAG: YqaE/Pmp3 family membrane protein [Bacteroidota bacterium]
MSVWRVILSLLYPLIAVYDRGFGSVLIVFILMILGCVPRVIGALVILNKLK